MRTTPEAYIGEQYGIYKIVDVLPNKDKYKRHLYVGECQECGFMKTGTISEFKNKNIQHCTHWHLLTDEQRNVWYEKNKRQCLHCGMDIPLKDLCQSKYQERNFCSQNCAASYNNMLRDIYSNSSQNNNCQNCGINIAPRRKFCSSKCQHEFQYKQYIERWKNGLESGATGEYNISKHIKKYLMDKFHFKCSQCGWGEVNIFTGNIPLEVHHKDGDHTNNSEDNLDLLCPNCHSLTATYKAANLGNGRKERKKYYN